MSEIFLEELESFEPRSRREAARALRQALIYLECEALDTGLPFTAYVISLAALSAAEVEAEN